MIFRDWASAAYLHPTGLRRAVTTTSATTPLYGTDHGTRTLKNHRFKMNIWAWLGGQITDFVWVNGFEWVLFSDQKSSSCKKLGDCEQRCIVYRSGFQIKLSYLRLWELFLFSGLLLLRAAQLGSSDGGWLAVRKSGIINLFEGRKVVLLAESYITKFGHKFFTLEHYHLPMSRLNKLLKD